MPTFPDVLRDEWEPEDRHVAKVEPHRPRHDNVAHDEFYPIRCKVIVRLREVARREDPALDPKRVAALEREVADDVPYLPLGAAAQHGANLALGVVIEWALLAVDLLAFGVD